MKINKEGFWWNSKKRKRTVCYIWPWARKVKRYKYKALGIGKHFKDLEQLDRFVVKYMQWLRKVSILDKE